MPPPGLSASRRVSALPKSLEDHCKEVVESQPRVLIIPNAHLAKKFCTWPGEVQALEVGSLSESTILPFVDRLPTVIRITMELRNNVMRTIKFKTRPDVVRSLHLVCSGALYGAGKTRISPVLHQCLQRVFEPEQKVVVCRVLKASSPYAMWEETVAKAPGMEGIKSQITEDMSLATLLDITASYLVQNNLLLFLHIDEFVPFDKTGKQENTKENFFECWERMLLQILLTPRMTLYISGRLPYLDSIGTTQPGRQSPCRVLSVQLDLFSADIIHDALSKMAIPSLPGITALTSGTPAPSAAATTTLTEALDALLPLPVTVKRRKGPSAKKLPVVAVAGTARDVARRLHELTGGVPRFFEHALHALLADPVMHAALFHGDRSGDLGKRVDSLFRQDGAVYQAVKAESEIHFGHAVDATNFLADDDKTRDNHIAGLLVIAFLQGRACHVESEDIQHLLTGTLNTGKLSFLLREALYWGFHRNLDQQQKTVNFPVPGPVLAGLRKVLINFADVFPPGLQRLTEKRPDQSGKRAEHAVEMALVFHRLLAGISDSPDWMRNGAGVSAPPLPISTAQITSWDKPSLFELPRLPRVSGSGKLTKVDEVKKITYSTHGDRADSRRCPPRLAGEFISSLSADAFHALATAPLSASANFIVRQGDDVAHLQVSDTRDLTVLKMLEDCGRVAAVMKGAPDLRHTLVWLMTQNLGLSDAQKSLACLNRLLGSDASAEKISTAVMSGKMEELLKPCKEDGRDDGDSYSAAARGGLAEEPAVVGGTVGKRTAAGERSQKNVVAGVQLLRSKELSLMVLNEDLRNAFLSYNNIATALLTGEVANLRVVK